MDGILQISRSVADRIRAEAAGSGREVCGILFTRETGAVVAAQRCDNVAADPARRFEIDPVALIAAHRAARRGGPVIVGHYHSHPGGSATPSIADAAAAAPDGSVWLIVAPGEMQAWRAVRDGAVHGRFDPLTLVVAD